MRVDIEHIEYLNKERRKINMAALRDIEFYKNGKRVEISDKIIEDFEFTGLINTDFISTGFYKTGFDS